MISPEAAKDMPVEAEGLGAAVAALDPVGRVEDDATQAELFASSPLLGADQKLIPERARGRPPGALNKTTEAWKGFILKHYRSPLLFLADLTMADPVKLHAMFGRHDGEDAPTLLQVVALQRQAAADLAPYLHRKQPIAIDAGEDKPLPSIQQLIVGPEALRTLFPQSAAQSETYDVEPVDEPGEVAGQKSHMPSADDASA